VVVLSAGLTSAVCERLAGLDVWRMLTKPVSVGALEACVREGLDGGAGVAMAAPLARPARRRSGASTTGGNEDQAIGAYFEGDRALFLAYRSACLERFPHDIREGDAASGSGDLVALRRVAHSLKSVLQMLGQTRCSVLARELEDTSHAGLPAPAQAQWAALREHLSTLLRCA
jgi:HPt (histidine-containing phosphotransfer) domain-containing protein